MAPSTSVGDEYTGQAQTAWQRWADCLARYAWLVLLITITVALIGGAVSASVGQTGSDSVQAEVVECENPPCFGGGGMPGLHDLPMIISSLGYGLAIILGLPSLLAGIWSLLRGNWTAGGRWLLTFLGPVLFFVGVEIVPHLLNPCYFAWALGNEQLPAICESNPAWGVDIAGRWHLLHHTLVGALPLAVLYWLALRKWRPNVVRFR